jgi:hypothetical protein
LLNELLRAASPVIVSAAATFGVGDGVGVAVRVAVAEGTSVGVRDGARVNVKVAVRVGTGVSVRNGVGVAEAVRVEVEVGGTAVDVTDGKGVEMIGVDAGGAGYAASAASRAENGMYTRPGGVVGWGCG